MDWSLVKCITIDNKPLVFFGFFSNHCMSREEYNNSDDIKNKKSLLDKIWERLIAEEVINGPESLLEDLLCDYIENIEDSMIFLDRQYKVENDIIDIVAKDINGVKCIIELKINDDDKNIVWQSAYYPSCFDEKVRMITIAPNYSNRIYSALKNVKNIEMKVFGKDENGLFEIKDFKVEETNSEIKKTLENVV